MTTVKKILDILDGIAPTHLAERGDPIGLQIGNMNAQIERLAVSLDPSDRVINAAIEAKAGMLITHHPLIFRPLETITTDNPVSLRAVKLIQHNMAFAGAHTNLDRAPNGTNDTLAELLGLKNTRHIIEVESENLYKIAVYVPVEASNRVAEAMGDAGAGHIGLYSHCHFRTSGKGFFKPLDGANPYIGKTGALEQVDEQKLETICTQKILQQVLTAMLDAHPYEEVAYDIYRLENKSDGMGFGRVGDIESGHTLESFAEFAAAQLQCKAIRYFGDPGSRINRVAVCSGAGSRFYMDALINGADVLVTGDVKHHDTIDANCLGLNIIDAGHYETERPGAKRLAQSLAAELEAYEVDVRYVE